MFLHQLQTRSIRPALLVLVSVLFLISIPRDSSAAPWSTKLDGSVRFYQQTEVGVLVVGTAKSLYGLDSESGEILWRRKDTSIDETDVALVSLERGDKTRLEAIDLLTGDPVWRSDKVRGAVMQMAFDPDANLLAVVMVRDARGAARDGFKRKPAVHMFDMSSGDELWKRELESEVEMMPTLWTEGKGDEVPYTLDNYRPPAFLDDRLYLFYEGVTSLEARSGKERRREKFRVNEEGLALTEADPVADEQFVYVSGRGHVRAISRTTGEEQWEAKDLGLTPEMILERGVLFVRTGGRFTRLRDGEVVERGPYGVSAIDATSGKVLWRHKGADKGITNLALPNSSTVVIADRDDLIVLDSATGERRLKASHKVEQASFIILNERGEAVVGGRNEVAAFNVEAGNNTWRSRHNPPGRGILRTVTAIAARAASLYFRYGGAATTAFRGAQVLRTLGSLRWSGLAAHATMPSLTSLAENYARDYARQRFSAFGILSRARETFAARNISIPRPSVDVQDRLLDKLDPATQLERLSRFLWRRRQLAALRGQWMYFYSELKPVAEGRGLVGVNINSGRPERAVRVGDPDDRFISDEMARLLYMSKGNQMVAYPLDQP